MNFIETRGNDGKRASHISFSQAILSPMSSFGGIYSPESLPDLGEDFLHKHLSSEYKTLAKAILMAFEIDVEEGVVDEALSLYDAFDDTKNPVPVVKVTNDIYVSELFHGPTRAFKDMALQPFGTVLSSLARKRGEEYLILAATSGDTGPAALDTFRDKAGVRVACLYPEGGTSDIQRLQMVTEDADNLKVIGIRGAFDDAQSALKTLLSSNAFNATLQEKNISLSAANSVNFGRIIFQIIYHIHSYLELVRQNAITMGENIYLNVPSGNFGNALGGYYAMKMGLPVEKIVISSNSNNVLTDFINKGEYDLRNRDVKATTSPAMDILKSSNVERILFDMFGAARTKELMTALDTDECYALSEAELTKLQKVFSADFCPDASGINYMKESFKHGYLMCPHTATCFKSAETCRDKDLKMIVYATAEWTKFSPVVAQAITEKTALPDLEAIALIENKANVELPPQIKTVLGKPVTQTLVVNKTDIESAILEFLN